tara:strand:- start:2241 stop:2402 length:162 start_codon:yes stop_codon:yes gene_type:complete
MILYLKKIPNANIRDFFMLSMVLRRDFIYCCSTTLDLSEMACAFLAALKNRVY